MTRTFNPWLTRVLAAKAGHNAESHNHNDIGNFVVYVDGKPVLVGTVSIDISEQLSKQLKQKGVPHEVLNAKNHEKEAEIISMAGQKGAVTISTNMAGRGTDIKLGEGVQALGGLHILGTERHESRRIDNQLRGCIGSLSATVPMAAGVRDNALNAALNDPRFSPLSRICMARSCRMYETSRDFTPSCTCISGSVGQRAGGKKEGMV